MCGHVQVLLHEEHVSLQMILLKVLNLFLELFFAYTPHNNKFFPPRCFKRFWCCMLQNCDYGQQLTTESLVIKGLFDSVRFIYVRFRIGTTALVRQLKPIFSALLLLSRISLSKRCLWSVHFPSQIRRKTCYTLYDTANLYSCAIFNNGISPLLWYGCKVSRTTGCVLCNLA